MHHRLLNLLKKVARVTGLEPATSGVTGRHSNQLSYTRMFRAQIACRNALAISAVFREVKHNSHRCGEIFRARKSGEQKHARRFVGYRSLAIVTVVV